MPSSKLILTFFIGENDLGKDIKRQGIDRNVLSHHSHHSLTTEMYPPGQQSGRGPGEPGEGAGGPRETAPAGQTPIRHRQLQPGSAGSLFCAGDNY